MSMPKFFEYWKQFVTKEAMEGNGYFHLYATPVNHENRYFLQGVVVSVGDETFDFETKRGTYTIRYENIFDAKAF